MERIIVSLREDGAALYDSLLAESAPQVGETIDIAVKAGAMVSGAAAVVLSFRAYVDGRVVRVQAVTSARCLLAAADAVKGALSDG